MKLFLFHCWGGDGRSCWSGWLSDRMKELGAEVVSPDFPETNEPKLEDWLETARKHVKRFDEGWALAGHSLGCPTILRLMEGFAPEERVGTVVLVAGFAKDLGIPQIRNFVEDDFDWEKIKSKAQRFVVISSDDDPFIELEEGERLAKMLGAEFIVERGAGHINEGSGFRQYQRLLDILSPA